MRGGREGGRERGRERREGGSEGRREGAREGGWYPQFLKNTPSYKPLVIVLPSLE